MPKVIIWRDDAIEAEFDPTHRDWRMGRSETNDIALMDPRKSVSRFHAELREENGAWYFIDLNSQNGSWHNGERVTRLLLRHDSEVSFGDYRLVFVDPASAPSVAAPFIPPPVMAPPDFGATVVAPVVPPPPPPPPPPPVNPDETLLMPSAKKAEVPTSPAGMPVTRPKAPEAVSKPRKGINPVVLVAFLLALVGVFGVVAFLAYSVLGGEPDPAPVKVATPAPAPVPTPAPVPEPPPVTEPAAVPPGEAPPGDAVAIAGATPSGPLPATKVAPRAPRKKAAAKEPTVPAEVEEQYVAGRRALTAQRFGEAVRAFEQVVAVMPGFRDAGELLARAKDGQTRAQAQALADGQRLEAAEEWSAAVAAYERAGAGANASGARTKMHAAGDDAYRRARQFDARNRAADAIGWYERAVEWLAAQDPRRDAARARLTELKGGDE